MDLPVQFGKYQLVERIAKGGMAEVYLANSFGLAGFERKLVIKRIRNEHAEDPRFISMFINEAKIGMHLNHPNVVQVYELGRVHNNYYIAMEHIHGKDLTRLVKTLRAQEIRLPIQVSVSLIAEICRGLFYAHNRMDRRGEMLGLVHRDVSPHNLIVSFAGEIKLVDFGIARLMNTTESQSSTKDPRPGGGKYAYMSPEQANGETVDHRTDIFSAGIVLWELIVGHRLYAHSDPEEKLRRVQKGIIPHPRDAGVEIEDSLWEVLSKALTIDREERYQNASLFEEDLRAWLFDTRSRVSRSDIAATMRSTFPEEAQRSFGNLDLKRAAADVERLDPVDLSGSLSESGMSGSTGSSTPQLPGHLRASTGGRKHVTAIMIDVDGVTAMSERLTPEALFMQHYKLLRWLRRIVDRYGGIVQRSVDDHILILFGVPRTRTDDLSRALDCILELQRQSEDLDNQGINVSLSIGVHSGEITTRASKHRVRYLARGNTTRLARRLSALADQEQILVSERILDAVEGEFVFRTGPSLKNRGGKPPHVSYLLEGRRRGLRIRARGAWLRRGPELEIIRQNIIGLGEGTGCALALVGEAGTGKTRLIKEIRDVAKRRKLPMYQARCHPTDHTGMVSMGDWVREILSIPPTVASPEMHHYTTAFTQLGLSQGDIENIFSILGGQPKYTRDIQEVWRALERLFLALAKSTPILLALDDAHYLSSHALPYLKRLIQHNATNPIMFLLSFKDKVSSALSDDVTTIALARFSPESQRRMMASMLEVETIHPTLADLAERTCEGNPRYVEELMKYLVQEGKIEIHRDQAHLSKKASGQNLGLPDSIAGLIEARIDALDPASRGILQLAAIIGPQFPVDLLADAAGIDTVTPLIQNLTAHGVIQKHDETHGIVSFSSDFVRQVALRGIVRTQQKDYHRLVAAAIERLYKEQIEGWAEAMIPHCAAGGRPIDAARYAKIAGDRFESMQFLAKAKDIYQQGLKVLEDAPNHPDYWDAKIQGESMLNLKIGIMALLLGDLQTGEKALQLALDISSEHGIHWVEVRVHLELGRSYATRGRNQLAKAHLDQARAMLRVEPDRELELEALEASANVAFEEGRNDEAETLWRNALEQAKDHPSVQARCEIGLANRFLRSGRYDEAKPLLFHALETAESASDRILQGRILNNIGWFHQHTGDRTEALSYYREALNIRREIGYTKGVVINHHNIGDIHFQNGDWGRAHAAFTRSLELADDMNSERLVLLNQIFLTYLDTRQCDGDVDAMKRVVDQAVSLGDGEALTTGAWLMGRLLLEKENYTDARKALKQAMAQAKKWDLQSMIENIERSMFDLDGSEYTEEV